MSCRCGSKTVMERVQQFKDGSEHIRIDCGECGLFIKWKPQGVKSYKDRMFDLVASFANATTSNQVNECQRIARELIREASEATKLDMTMIVSTNHPGGMNESEMQNRTID